MWTGRTLRLTSFTAQFSCFDSRPERYGNARPFLTIDRSPVIDVTEVRARVTGDPTPQEQDGFLLVQGEHASTVFLQKGAEAPDIDPDIDFPIEVDFRTGYTHESPASPEKLLPPSVRTGIQQHVAFMFENRGDVKDGEDGVPMVVKRSYSPIKLLRTAGGYA